MVLYFIGLGLNPTDVSIRAVNIIKKCTKVFLETYTSILVSYEEMTELVNDVLGKDVVITPADRKLTESHAETILDPAVDGDVAFLVVGDPFCATTHCDLVLRAKERNIECVTLHNASIINAVGCTGLEVYKFGRVISIPIFDGNWRPDSFYERIVNNHKTGLHTLCLLDIKTKEPNLEALFRGKEKYDPPRYMFCPLAARQLVEVEENKKGGVATKNTICVACVRIGTPTQNIVCTTLGKLSEMEDTELGGPLHSLILPNDQDLSDMEAKMLITWVKNDPELIERLKKYVQ